MTTLMIQRWYRRVYALCRSQLISASDAEDATQETFARCMARIDQLRTSDAIGCWLRSIAHHVCVDTIRRNRVRQATTIEDVPAGGERHPNPVEEKDQQEHLIRLIHRLPESLREVVLLHYYEELTYDEIAAWLGVARSTVNERLSKARRMLKHELMSAHRCFDEV